MIKHNIFANLLRIMTPEEINELTKSFDGNERIPLTQIVNDDLFYFSDEKLEKSREDSIAIKAKIIPINQSVAAELKKEPQTNLTEMKFVCGNQVRELLGQFKNESLNSENNIFASKRNSVKESDENYESTEFILNQLSKTQKNNEKLKKLNVWKLYSQNAVVDIDITKGKTQSIVESSTKGILINKKQA